MSAPIRVVLDQHWRQLHHPNRRRHDRTDRDVEVDARYPRRTAAAQHGFTHLGLLLDGQGLMACVAGPLLAALSIVALVAFAALCVVALVAFAALRVVAFITLVALSRIIALIALGRVFTLAFTLWLAALFLLCFLLALLLLARPFAFLSLSALL